MYEDFLYVAEYRRNHHMEEEEHEVWLAACKTVIAEITGGYELIIPLMIVSALSYAVSKYFMPLSIDLLKLSEKEKIDTSSTDSYLLSNINLSQFVP